jgi:hypothetical protein
MGGHGREAAGELAVAAEPPPIARPEPPGRYVEQEDGSFEFVPDDPGAFERMGQEDLWAERD